MKSLYIFLSLIFFLFLRNETAFAQNQESNEKVVHKAIDKMNYEFAIAVLKRINEIDNTVKFAENKEVKDTTFSKVAKLKPTIQAKSLDRIFSKEKMSDGVAGYIYDIDFIKLSSKSYPTDNLPSTINSLDKIVNKVVARTNDFGDKQSKFKLTPKQLSDLKLKLAKIKNSAVSSLSSNEKIDLPKEEKIDSIKQDSTTKQDIEVKTEKTQTDSSKIIYYKINQDEEKELTGIDETTEDGRPTYKFGLDINKNDSVQFRVKGNSDLDTAFLVASANNSLILEGNQERYIIDLNIATTQEENYMILIILGVIAVSVIGFVMYKQYEKNKPITPKEIKKNVVKKDPLSRDNVATKVVSPITQNVQNTNNKERETILIQNQIQEEKNRLTAILTNSKLSDEQKLKEARSKNITSEVANNSEIKELIRVIEELSTKIKVENTEKEPVENVDNKENKIVQKVATPPKNTKNYHEPLYVALSDIGENGIKSERKKGMSNTIFVIRPYSEGENEPKKADFTLHSDIKDMAFESIFRSIEKLDHLMEHTTFTDTARKITQEEKGELIKEDDVWKVKNRLKVKFS